MGGGIITGKNPGYIQWEKRIQMANEDIDRIDTSLNRNNDQELRELHRELDAKYQQAISAWGNSLYGYISGQGTVSDMDLSAIVANLKTMKGKIQAFSLGMNALNVESSRANETNVNVTVNNGITINISFVEAKNKIENMTSLSREETDEILKRIEELEKINFEKDSKKNKWAKIKPIVQFALDKGADVGITILSLILQMQF